jgi:hypothetical protein
VIVRALIAMGLIAHVWIGLKIADRWGEVAWGGP